MSRTLQPDPVVCDLARTRTRRDRIWLHVRCIVRALAGIVRELWPRRAHRPTRYCEESFGHRTGPRPGMRRPFP